MKRLMMMVMLVGLVYASHAQRRPQRPESIEKRIERAKEELSLSDDQVESWKAVHEKYEADLKAAREARDREKGEATRKKIDEELRAILTEEQQEKFEEMKKKRRKGGRGR